MIIARQSLQGLCPTLTFEDPAACTGTVREAMNIFQDGVITYWSCLLNHSTDLPRGFATTSASERTPSLSTTRKSKLSEFL